MPHALLSAQCTIAAMLPRVAAVRLSAGLLVGLLLVACGPMAEPDGAIPSVPSESEPSGSSWKGFSGAGNYRIDQQTLLPLAQSSDVSTASGTADPVIAEFERAARSQLAASALPVEVQLAPGLDPVIGRAAHLGVEALGRVVGYWRGDREVFLLVTSTASSHEEWLRTTVEALGCSLGDPWYPFTEDELPGSFVLRTCGPSRDVLVLNVSQFARPWADSDPSRVLVTVADDLFGLWQEHYNTDVLEEEPRWFTQGSQQVPFLLYVAQQDPSRLSKPQLSSECLPDLTAYDFENIEFNTEVSCPHELGRAAMLLLVSRVGIDPIVEYFTRPGLGTFEDFDRRFRQIAGESYSKFNARLKSWVVTPR